MRKILMIIIVILLILLGYVIVMKGVQLGTFELLSVQQIDDKNKVLTSKIEEINTLVDINFPKKLSELNTASSKLQQSKDEYLQYTNLSTDEEILNAMQNKSYAIEFLWTKIGTHAREEGINLKLEIVNSSTGSNAVNDLRFTANGSYIGITNFVYSLENDSDLNFTIENFKLLPYNGEILQGTFTVRNIAIEGNTSKESVRADGTQTTDTTDTTDNKDANTVDTNTVDTNTVQE